MVQKLAAAGCRVDVSTLDVADAGEAAQLLADAGRAAPVGGIFHLAMVLDDRLIINQARGARVRVLSGLSLCPARGQWWPVLAGCCA